MKKLISLSLALIMIIAVVFAVPASAADGLSITAEGKDPKTFAVGDEIVYNVSLVAGPKAILDGQGYVTYDPNYLEVIEFEAEDAKGESSPEAYSFPTSIYNAAITLNTSVSGQIFFNFTASNGIDVFNDSENFFARFRFKVKAAGSTDVSTTIEYMIDEDEARVFYGSEPGEGKDAAIYGRIEKAPSEQATRLVGDVDGNGKVNNRDAVILDRYIAQWDNYADYIVDMDLADLDRNGKVNNRDAVILDRYVADWEGYDQFIIYIV